MNAELFAAIDAYCSGAAVPPAVPTTAAAAATTAAGSGTPASTDAALHAKKVAAAAALPEGMGAIVARTPPRLSLLDLIREMGGYMMAPDGMVRRRATQLLGAAVEAAAAAGDPYLVANVDVLHTLIAFFCGRLADYPSVPPCLRVLRVLLDVAARLPALSAAAVEVSKALFVELHVQAMEQAQRQAVYELLGWIAAHPALSAQLLDRVAGGGDTNFALEFAVGVVTAMDGEKDPRCLMPALRLVATLLWEPSAEEGAGGHGSGGHGRGGGGGGGRGGGGPGRGGGGGGRGVWQGWGGAPPSRRQQARRGGRLHHRRAPAARVH